MSLEAQRPGSPGRVVSREALRQARVWVTKRDAAALVPLGLSPSPLPVPRARSRARAAPRTGAAIVRSKRGVWRCSWLQVTLPGSWRLAVGGVDDGRGGGLGLPVVMEQERTLIWRSVCQGGTSKFRREPVAVEGCGGCLRRAGRRAR